MPQGRWAGPLSLLGNLWAYICFKGCPKDYLCHESGCHRSSRREATTVLHRISTRIQCNDSRTLKPQKKPHHKCLSFYFPSKDPWAGLRVSGLGVRVKGLGSDLELALQGVHTHTHDLTNTLAHTHLPYNPSIPVAPFVKSVTPLAPPSLSPTFQMPTPIDPGECNVRYMHESNPNP